MVLQNELVDEDLEHFEDMVEEPHIQTSKTADKPDSDGGDDSENEIDDHSEDEAPCDSDDEFSDKSDDDLLGFGGLANLQESKRPFGQTSSQLRVQNAESFVPGGYNLQHREPMYWYISLL